MERTHEVSLFLEQLLAVVLVAWLFSLVAAIVALIASYIKGDDG